MHLWLAHYGISDLANLHPHLEEHTMPSTEDQFRKEILHLQRENHQLKKNCRTQQNPCRNLRNSDRSSRETIQDFDKKHQLH